MGYLIRMQGWHPPGGAGAGRTATVVVIVALVALLSAAGCRLEKPAVEKAPVVVGAGDIADCRTEGDEATAKLVEGIDGATVLTLGDNAYPKGTDANFAECYALMGAVQGAHHAKPRQPRVRDAWRLRLLRVLREGGRRPR